MAAEETAIVLLNDTIQQLPIFATLQVGFDILKILLGGLFGFYVISFLINLYFRLKEIRLLNRIEAKLETLSKRIDSIEKKKK